MNVTSRLQAHEGNFMTLSPYHRFTVSPSHRRRGFNLVELLIALAISSMLLTATMVALKASFMAYQTTTEEASTHTISRLAMHRIMALVRTSTEFGPIPDNPLDEFVESDFVVFRTAPAPGAPNGHLMQVEWVESPTANRPVGEALYIVLLDPVTEVETSAHLLLEGVRAQFRPLTDPIDPGGRVRPFTLQYEKGRYLHRATVDMVVHPDDNMAVMLDGNTDSMIRMIGSAMPRMVAY
jgi:prepilin-type N-terminal cleavage/methylation domain-containing protein